MYFKIEISCEVLVDSGNSTILILKLEYKKLVSLLFALHGQTQQQHHDDASSTTPLAQTWHPFVDVEC